MVLFTYAETILKVISVWLLAIDWVFALYVGDCWSFRDTEWYRQKFTIQLRANNVQLRIVGTPLYVLYVRDGIGGDVGSIIVSNFFCL